MLRDLIGDEPEPDTRTLEEVLQEFDNIRGEHEPLAELEGALLARWLSAYRRWVELTRADRRLEKENN